jgi:hypothetical protein
MISSVIQRGFSVGALSSLAPLPETAVELAFIARHFSDSLIVTGLDATEEKIRENGSSSVQCYILCDSCFGFK